jgi:hypothetical protein
MAQTEGEATMGKRELIAADLGAGERDTGSG